MSRLITTSLIGSIDWYKQAPNSLTKENQNMTWKQKAYNDLKNTLSRIWTEPNKYAKRGIDFENKVYELLNKNVDIEKLQSSYEFKKVLYMCKGGDFQIKTKRFIDVDGKEYCLYGKIDVNYPEQIIDIKTTKYTQFLDKVKYTNSFQHRIYLYNTGKMKFIYLIVLFDEQEFNKIIDVQTIHLDIGLNHIKQYEKEIINKIKEIEQFFKEYPELGELYETKYCLY